MNATPTSLPTAGRPPRSANDDRAIDQMAARLDQIPGDTDDYLVATLALDRMCLLADARAFDRVAAKFDWWALGGRDGSPDDVIAWRLQAQQMRQAGDVFRTRYGI